MSAHAVNTKVSVQCIHMGDCVSMYCPRLIQQGKLISDDFILCDDWKGFCTKHAESDLGIKKCRCCSNGFFDCGDLDQQCCVECCEMAFFAELF